MKLPLRLFHAFSRKCARPRVVRAMAFALATAWNSASIAGVDTFVNVSGLPAPVPGVIGAPGVVALSNPEIEKFLSQPSDLWERIRQGFAMPDLDHKLVAQQTAWYAARPELVQAILQRASRYLHFIVDEVERRGLPTELALLPFIESGFNPMALSPAQASGLWQFIPATGSKFNLVQNDRYDGRRDVVASTGAALDYLQFLYRYNEGDWHRALASYNWGESAVARAVEQNRSRGLSGAYEHLSMPDETRNYVPRLLAIKNIVMDPAAYGIDLGDLPNQPTFLVVPISDEIALKRAAEFAGMSLEEFMALNPAFSSNLVPGGPGAVIPLARADLFKSNLGRHREMMASQAGAPRTGARKLPKHPAGGLPPSPTVPVTRF